MRVLLVSVEPVRKDNSSGNTLLNLFAEMDDVELACICARSGNSDEKVARSFCITEKTLVENFFGRGPSGILKEGTHVDCVKNGECVEQKIIKFMKSHRNMMFYFLQKFIWRFGRWKSQELYDFIKDFDPDIVFTYLTNFSFINRLTLYAMIVTKAPMILYAWDNNYSLKRFMISPFKWIYHLSNRRMIEVTAKNADLMYVISEEQKNDYEKAFRRECKILTKSADFSSDTPVNEEYNTPIRLLYTGNVGLGRWKSLRHIVNALEKINCDGIKAQLYIYTGEVCEKKVREALNKGESSFLMGSVSSAEVAELQEQADILVHVEALDIKNRLLVRQSFSTKLVDYFHQAKCILAFGPKNVASIAHLIRNDAAIVADSEEKLEEKMRRIIENPDLLKEYGKKAWECGKKHHDKEKMQNMLKEDLKKVIGTNEGRTN